MIYGFYPDMLKVFSEKLNFTIREFQRNDDVWGKIDPVTNEWSGMVKNLIDQEADLITGNLCYLRNRLEVIDFLQPLNNINLGFAIRGV